MLTRSNKKSKLRQTGITNFLNGKTITKYLVFIMFFLVLALLIAINSPKQNFIKTLASNFFSGNTPIPSVEITTEDYDNEGSIKVTKEAHWVSKTEAELNINLETIRKTGENKKDIVLVFDVSGSMEGEKLEKVKQDASELIEYVLDKDEDNKIGLITFASTSRIISPLTNNKESLLEAINNMSTEDATNYYLAYKDIETILEGYSKESGKDLVVLFMTDGVPTDGNSAQGVYESLKEQYPYITINAVEYEMGDTTNSVNDISDNQWTAKIDSLNNVLFEATVSPEVYEKLSIIDYINDNYFEIEDQTNNKIEWDFRDNSFITGSEDTLTIKLKLKDEYKDVKGLYPTNKKLDIDYKISGVNKSKSSTDTPILKNNYDVYYDVNTPPECNLEEIESENHFVFDNVTKKDIELSCSGYDFKGWDMEENVTKINDETFIMPESDVHIRAIWTRQSINKSMDGKINEKTTLYKVVENEAKIGTYAQEYTGEHADAYDRSGTEKIYHYATTSTNGTVANQQAEVILNKFNVIFGGFCWQILRTTDTGGVKLLYNGVPDSNGTCNNTGTAQQIGTKAFNSSYNSPACVGYMYNKLYTWSQFDPDPRTTVINRVALNQTHYYANTYEYNQSVANRYKLYNDPDTDGDDRFTAQECIANGNCNEVLTGTYTFSNTNPDYNTTTIRYVVGVSGEYVYYLELKNGQTLEDVNPTFYTGDGYTDNQDGTYTITSTSGTVEEFKKADWFTKYTDSKNKYICIGSNPCTSPIYTINTAINTYNAESIIKDYIYASDFDYVLNEETNEYEYVLKDTEVANKIHFWDWHAKYNTINNNHYTCFNTTGKCSELKYIYYTSAGEERYITLKDGKSVEDALNEMLYDENVNVTDSTMKAYLEAWYSENLSSYESYLEDTVFCNDRTIRTKNGWEPNGGNTTAYLLFKENSPTKDLSCTNTTDRFSTLNEKAKLAYPIGLASQPEVNLLNNLSIRKTGQNYWLASPSHFNLSFASERSVDTAGVLDDNGVVNAFGVRPVVSVRPGTEYIDGDGSKNNPYVVDTSDVSVGG